MSKHKAVPNRTWVVMLYQGVFGYRESIRGECAVCGKEVVRVYRNGMADALATWRHLPVGYYPREHKPKEKTPLRHIPS